MKRLFVVLSLCLASSAYANVLYSNGPVDGTTGAYFLDFRTVSDQFNPSGSTMTGFDIALWVSPGSVPVQFDWRVGTLPFDGSLGSATAIIGRGVTASLLCTSGSSYNGGICGRNNGFDIYWVSVTTSAITVGNGDWLTLGNGGDSSGLGIAWDVKTAVLRRQHTVPTERFPPKASISPANRRFSNRARACCWPGDSWVSPRCCGVSALLCALQIDRRSVVFQKLSTIEVDGASDVGPQERDASSCAKRCAEPDSVPSSQRHGV